MEWKWQVKSEILGETTVTEAIYPADISRGLDLDGVWVSSVGGRRLNAWTMALLFKAWLNSPAQEENGGGGRRET
jgi:hypothetical protein